MTEMDANGQDRWPDVLKPRKVIIVFSLVMLIVMIIFAVTELYLIAFCILITPVVLVILVLCYRMWDSVVLRFVVRPLFALVGRVLPRRFKDSCNSGQKLKPFTSFLVFVGAMSVYFSVSVIVVRDIAVVFFFFVGFGMIVGIPTLLVVGFTALKSLRISVSSQKNGNSPRRLDDTK